MKQLEECVKVRKGGRGQTKVESRIFEKSGREKNQTREFGVLKKAEKAENDGETFLLPSSLLLLSPVCVIMY